MNSDDHVPTGRRIADSPDAVEHFRLSWRVLHAYSDCAERHFTTHPDVSANRNSEVYGVHYGMAVKAQEWNVIVSDP